MFGKLQHSLESLEFIFETKFFRLKKISFLNLWQTDPMSYRSTLNASVCQQMDHLKIPNLLHIKYDARISFKCNIV